MTLFLLQLLGGSVSGGVLPLFSVASSHTPFVYYFHVHPHAGFCFPCNKQSPMNYFIDNAASNTFAGFWFSMPLAAQGPSAAIYGPTDPIVRPRNNRCLGFKGNVGHNGMHGVLVASFLLDEDLVESLFGPSLWLPMQEPLPPNVGGINDPIESITLVSLFEGTIAYRNRESGIWAKGRQRIVGSILDDNSVGLFAAARVSGGAMLFTNSPVSGALFCIRMELFVACVCDVCGCCCC